MKTLIGWRMLILISVCWYFPQTVYTGDGWLLFEWLPQEFVEKVVIQFTVVLLWDIFEFFYMCWSAQYTIERDYGKSSIKFIDFITI